MSQQLAKIPNPTFSNPFAVNFKLLTGPKIPLNLQVKKCRNGGGGNRISGEFLLERWQRNIFDLE